MLPKEHSVCRKAESMMRASRSSSKIPTRRSLLDAASGSQPSLADAASQADAFEVLTVAGSGRLGVVDGPAERATFATPSALLQLPDGSLLVSDTANNRLRRLVRQPESGQVSVHTVCAKVGWLSPRGLALLRDGGVLVCDSGHHKLRRIDPADWSVAPWAGNGKRGHRDGAAAGAQFDCPSGLCVCPDGTVLVADAGNHCIRCVVEQPAAAGGGATRWLVRTVAGGAGERGHRDGAAPHARFDAPHSVLAPQARRPSCAAREGLGEGDRSGVGPTRGGGRGGRAEGERAVRGPGLVGPCEPPPHPTGPARRRG